MCGFLRTGLDLVHREGNTYDREAGLGQASTNVAESKEERERPFVIKHHFESI